MLLLLDHLFCEKEILKAWIQQRNFGISSHPSRKIYHCFSEELYMCVWTQKAIPEPVSQALNL